VINLKTTYTLIHKDGTHEEKPFTNGMISEHISQAEFGEHDGAGRLRENVSIEIFEPLIQLFEAVRGAIGKPITINSGYRSKEKQAELYAKDPSGAVTKPGHSPHMYGAAMDLALPDGWDARKFADFIRKTSVSIGLPMARTGWKRYNGRFVHVDLVHMLFKPYINTPIKINDDLTIGGVNPAPGAWKAGVTW
jgi:uncharacterized protein YcbK (DUF882 family)